MASSGYLPAFASPSGWCTACLPAMASPGRQCAVCLQRQPHATRVLPVCLPATTSLGYPFSSITSGLMPACLPSCNGITWSQGCCLLQWHHLDACLQWHHLAAVALLLTGPPFHPGKERWPVWNVSIWSNSQCIPSVLHKSNNTRWNVKCSGSCRCWGVRRGHWLKGHNGDRWYSRQGSLRQWWSTKEQFVTITTWIWHYVYINI